jgi:Cft2 family RNA processing exonuclease
MNCIFDGRGIFLSDIDLWLDSREPAANNWISHAHGDHAQPGHGRVWATPQTMAIYLKRFPEAAASTLQEIGFGQSWDWKGSRLTAYPAGHILGAAQLLVDYQGERLVYTGDIKLRPPMLGETTVPIECDRLIIESTFGLPIYHFLSREEAILRIQRFARECFADSVTPVLFGYPLGRGQEIVSALCREGIPAAVHGAIARLIPEYENAGYPFPGWEPYVSDSRKDRALVLVPVMRDVVLSSSRDARIAYVSGWAALDNARARSGAEELIPYSDHADFDELLQLVEYSRAKRVDVVHGYTEAFARILRARGIDAYAAQAAIARPEGDDA